MTPSEFEQKYGVGAKRLRAHLRVRYPAHRKNDPWQLDSAMVANACSHFGLSGPEPAATTSTSTNLAHHASSLAPTPNSVPLLTRPSSKRSSGLHVPVLEAATKVGIPLSLGSATSWLSSRGHTLGEVQRSTPYGVLSALESIHRELGGDASTLRSKRLGNAPTPDLLHDDLGCIIEVDEVQHFTTSRLRSFTFYPADVPLGFDLGQFVALAQRWAEKGDRAFAHKTAADFPAPGGRQAQRAYNDALRDLLAPTFTGFPVIRLAVPDRDLTGAVDNLRRSLRNLGARGARTEQSPTVRCADIT